MKIEKAVTEYNLSLIGRIGDKSRYQYLNHVNKLVQYLPETDIEKITARDLRHWRADLIESKQYKDRTINHVLADVKRFFGFLVSDGLLPADPAAGLALIKEKNKNKSPAAISVDDFLRLLNHAVGTGKKRDAAIILTLFGTGCRVSGLTRLKLEDLDLSEGKAWVFEKGDKGRWVYLDPPVVIALEDYIYIERPNNRGPQVFHGERGVGLTRQAVWYILKRHARAANVKGCCNPHAFRHAFAIQMLLRGMSLSAVSKLLGHEGVGITHAYYTRFEQKQLQQLHRQYSIINDLVLAPDS